jgi:hypothetical protein
MVKSMKSPGVHVSATGTVSTLKFVYTLLSRSVDKLMLSSIGARINRITTEILLMHINLSVRTVSGLTIRYGT